MDRVNIDRRTEFEEAVMKRLREIRDLYTAYRKELPDAKSPFMQLMVTDDSVGFDCMEFVDGDLKYYANAYELFDEEMFVKMCERMCRHG